MTHNLRTNCDDYPYLWQRSAWPVWRFDVPVLSRPLADLSCAQGLLIERLADVGMALCNQARLTILSEDVIKTSAIEDEQLNALSVHSSIARRPDVNIGAPAPVDRHVEGVIDGFDGTLTSSKWAAIAKCSSDTALRDITDLLTLEVLRKSDAGGRSTSYVLNDLSRSADTRGI